MKKREQKPDKVQRVINIILCLLPILALSTYLYWVGSQKSVLNNIVSEIENGNTVAALELLPNLENIDNSNRKGRTVLMMACKHGDEEVIKAALKRNADPNYSPAGALTPLEMFCQYGYDGGPNALYVLLKAGANPKIYTVKSPIETLVEQLTWMTKEQKQIASEEILLLLQAGSPLEFNDTTILHYAAQHNLGDLANKIIRSNEGYELVIVKNAEGDTPYTVAVKNGAVQVQQAIRHFEDELRGYAEDPLAESTPSDGVIESNPNEEQSLEELIDILNGFTQQAQQNSLTDPTTP